MTRATIRLLSACVLATLLIVPAVAHAAQHEVRLPAGSELLGKSLDGERLTLLLRSGENQVTLDRYEDGERRWSVPLDFTPAGSPLVSRGGSTFVAAYACEACAPGPLRIVSDAGQVWTPEGRVESVHVAELADRLLVHSSIDGHVLLRVYSGSGRVVGEVQMPSVPIRHVDLAATGDAILLVEGDVGAPGHAIRLYDLTTESWERQVLPNDEAVGSATAFDRQTVISWGDWGEGSLRLHRFGAGGRGESGVPRGWSRSFDERPYYPVDLAADAGLILATDGGKVYQVLDSDGEVLWSLRPQDETARLAGWLGISEEDARGAAGRVRVELAGDGSVILSEAERGLMYLLRWLGDGGYEDAPTVLRFNAANTTLDGSGRYAVEASADTLRYGSVDDW